MSAPAATTDLRRRSRTGRARPGPILAALALAVGVWAGGHADRAFRVAPAPAGPRLAEVPEGATLPPLTLRLVDAGGVGIPPASAGWDGDYSHNTRAFHELMRLEPPYVDERAFRGVRGEWETYLDRMAAYGNNGVVLPVFLELVNFDRLDDGYAVYAADSPYRARHLALRERFGELFGAASARGFGVYLKTDMLTLTEPLARHLGDRPGGLDASNPELWRTYRAALEELFAAFPSLDGVVVRVGEAGPLFNRPGWPYWSQFGVNDVARLRLMLRELLPVFEARGRSLILRTWSVGPGELGGLHTDPAVYDAALGDVDSPSLIVSTKYLQGDFFGFLPTNPTLLRGSQRRIVEFQARREFEGFGAFPNDLGAEHRRALRQVLAGNPRVVGTWLWTQDGGPLRAGPRSLYPLHGFWHWIDANVFVTSRLAADPGADVGSLTRDWVRREIADDPEVVEAVGGILARSRGIVLRGFYIRPFAEQRVRMGRVDVPPLLWIMEWDVLGGWSAALSAIYGLVRDDPDGAVAEGFAAAQEAGEARRALERLEPRLAHRSALYERMRRSLLYEESLLTTLAWYRGAFLAYYRWLDTGEAAAFERWGRSVEAYRIARDEHRSRYRGDLDFPAFEFGPADGAIDIARRGRGIAWTARIGLVLMVALAAWWWRRPRALILLLLASITFAVAALFSFATWRLPAWLLACTALFALALRWSWGSRGRSDSPAVTPMAAPAFAAVALMLGAVSLRGPLHAWLLFWSAPAFRGVLVAVLVALLVWIALGIVLSGWERTGRLSTSLGGLLIAAGATTCAGSLLTPGTRELLHALHEPLALLPLTHAIVQGILTYLGIPPAPATYAAAIGLLLVGGGLALARSRRAPTDVTTSWS